MNTHIDNHGAGAHKRRANEARLSQCCNEDICLHTDIRQTARVTVTERHGCITAGRGKEHCKRTANDGRAADNYHACPRKRHLRTPEQVHNPRRGAGNKPRLRKEERTTVKRMKAVDIFFWRHCAAHPRCVKMRR